MRAPLASLAKLAARLGRATDAPPVLVIRLPELERLAWRRGLRAARALERRAVAAFASAVARVLRTGDVVGHDPGSDVFVAALLAPTREGAPAAAPVDARSALARIAATMEATTRLDCLTGWTAYDPLTDRAGLARVVERALLRGAQERERYAFFSALGHELRTPLSSIRGYLETLLDDEVDERTRRRFVRIAYNESLRLSRLVDGMFEISLLDLHAALPGESSGALDRALEAAADACAAQAAQRGVTLDVEECPAASAARVAMDADRLTLVLINLIGNAIRHGRPGGTVRVGVDLSEPRHARLTVDDDGPGIPAADRERVFALGQRGATSASGTGIGLALVRLMLERVGGRVCAEESPLGGARFVVRVPRRPEP